MYAVVPVSLAADPADSPPHDSDASIELAAEALLACHARGADSKTMLAMCERLLMVTERQMLQREERMMATGDENLATQVRRHGDVLFVLGQQVKASRRSSAPLAAQFLQFVSTLAGKYREPRIAAA